MLLGVFMLCFFAACKKDSIIAPLDMGYAYFPLNLGHTILYEADSVRYSLDANDSVHIRKVKFQVQDVIKTTFYDNSNRLTYVFERSKRMNDTAAWEPWKICTANLLEDALHWKEDNYTYVNLAFPIKSQKQWNGNSYNILGESEFTYTDIHIPYAYKNISTDSSLTVIQQDEVNGLETNWKEEKYAKHTGLIHHEMIHYEKDLNTGNLTGGFEFRMKAIQSTN